MNLAYEVRDGNKDAFFLGVAIIQAHLLEPIEVTQC